jgi:hypothetical protein
VDFQKEIETNIEQEQKEGKLLQKGLKSIRSDKELLSLMKHSRQ